MYNPWHLTKKEGQINFPAQIESYDTIYVKSIVAGWGEDTLADVSYNNKPIASKHAVHGYA
ncbi:MAG: hypothetical protein KAG53_08615 [Endozoicomonadaceae bacterium]|nr:hypothetical protein [Endozoicomonadaceae bacterium]